MLWMAPFFAYGFVTGGTIVVTKAFAFKWVVFASTICAINSWLTSTAIDTSPSSMTPVKFIVFVKKCHRGVQHCKFQAIPGPVSVVHELKLQIFAIWKKPAFIKLHLYHLWMTWA